MCFTGAQHACRLGYEGIVSKRIDLPYRGGRSKIWLKTKNKDHPAMQRVRDVLIRSVMQRLLPGPSDRR